MFAEKIYTTTVLFIVALFIFSSCEEKINHNGRTPLVGVGKDFLYKEDVEQMLATTHPTADSAKIISNYVRHWLGEVLLYHKARRNVPDTKEVERLVDNYRKALLLNIYQDKLIEQQLNREISEAEIASFYEQNKELFLLDEPMAQGIFIKISKSASKMPSVRAWMKSATPEDVEKLEKFSLTNAIVYDYFADGWRSLSNLAAMLPVTADVLLTNLKRDNFVEFSDSSAVYMLNVPTLLRKGELKPLDMASSEIKSLLLNSLKANFVKEVKRDLYNKALESGEVKIYDKGISVALKESLSATE